VWDKARELLGRYATLPLARAISDSARWVSVLPGVLGTAATCPMARALSAGPAPVNAT